MTDTGVRVLREFLYVDSDKVRAILGQLDEGVREELQRTERATKSTSAGTRAFAWHQRENLDEARVSRSLADSNFPELEQMLEAEGLLCDLSDKLSAADNWLDDDWRRDAPPGALIRITLRGMLFDARYVAQVLSGYASVVAGLQGIGVMKGSPGSKTQERQARTSDPQIEDNIPLFAPVDAGESKVNRSYLQAIVRIAKGAFTQGFHLLLLPDDGADYAVTARLEEGRRYLDSTPEILISRYGIEPQEWTLVGSVGHYPSKDAGEPPPFADVTGGTGTVSRTRMADVVQTVVRHLAATGLVDLPRYPSFSVVPIAVYRSTSIGREIGNDLAI